MNECDALRQFRQWNRQNEAGLPENCPANGDPHKAKDMSIKGVMSGIPEWPEGMSASDYRAILTLAGEMQQFAAQLLPKIYPEHEQRKRMIESMDPASPICNMCEHVRGNNGLMAKWRQMYGSKDSFPSGANSHRGNRIGIGATSRIRE